MIKMERLKKAVVCISQAQTPVRESRGCFRRKGSSLNGSPVVEGPNLLVKRTDDKCRSQDQPLWVSDGWHRDEDVQ